MTTRIIAVLTLTMTAFAADMTAVATPAQRAIRLSEERIQKNPDHAANYNELAMAYSRRARENSDVAFYVKAEEAVQKSLELEPDNFGALKARVWALLGRHEFAQALTIATEMNKRVPDDITVYGYLVDANVELGNYADAVKSAQWMLDLRAGNLAGLTRAAYLRELHGDLTGAMDLMQAAYDATSSQEVEDRAWLLTQLSHLHLVNNNVLQAERYAVGALNLFPDYHYALAALAKVRATQGRHDEEAALLQKRYDAAPHAENLYSLAAAMDRAGHTAEAAEAFREFETNALAESEKWDNSNRELMSYYVDVAHDPAKALAIAEREVSRKHDVFTLDGYAWALAAVGEKDAARTEITKAVAFGTRDPEVLHHAALLGVR